MKLYLIRHGETVDNVAQLYAGSTDSALTSHGHLQTTRLGSYFTDHKIRFTHIYSSDLSRARKTAESVLEAQRAKYGGRGEKAKPGPSTERALKRKHSDDNESNETILKRRSDDSNERRQKSKHSELIVGVPTKMKHGSEADGTLRVVQFASLREQDFGSLEKCSFVANPRATRRSSSRTASQAGKGDPEWRDVESKDSLNLRARSFVEVSLLPIILGSTAQRKEPVVAVVSHGMTLTALWRALLKRFALYSVSLASGVEKRPEDDHGFERLGGWSNTGYLELDIQHVPSNLKTAVAAVEVTKGVAISLATSPSKPVTPIVLYDWSMKILAINCTAHLKSLKRTKGGLGSAKHEENQKSLESYFNKKRRTE